ncbi:MAG: Bug family tripartite tricarboxylate transporter substrate binding protein, partial [Verrucomicrobiia bacterium]
MKTSLLVLFLIAITSFAGAFPDKPIRIIVPTEAGGGHDTIARIFQRAIQEKALLSEKLVIVNIPGAGGAVGTRKIKDSPNDGYTIGIWNPNALISAKLMGITRYDHNDYEIIGMTGFTDLGMGVKTESSINSVSSMIERGKSKPGALKLATEIGTAAHIIPMILANKAEFEFRVVPSGGGSKRL